MGILGRMLMWLALASLLAAQPGCATIFKGSTQTITVATDPPGGVLIYEGKRMKTPARVTLARKRDHVMYVEWPDKTVIARFVDPANSGVWCMVFAWSFDIALLIVPWIVDLNTDACVNFADKIVISPETGASEGGETEDAP